METSGKQCVAYAEHVEGGLLIVFVDGASAIYTDAFLRQGLGEMKKLKPVIASI